MWAVVAKAGGDDDDDIVAGKQKMSLKCPVGLHLREELAY